jgi:hypothetical protein
MTHPDYTGVSRRIRDVRPEPGQHGQIADTGTILAVTVRADRQLAPYAEPPTRGRPISSANCLSVVPATAATSGESRYQR